MAKPIDLGTLRRILPAPSADDLRAARDRAILQAALGVPLAPPPPPPAEVTVTDATALPQVPSTGAGPPPLPVVASPRTQDGCTAAMAWEEAAAEGEEAAAEGEASNG